MNDDSALWHSLNEDDFFKDIADGDGAVDSEGVDGFADVWDALDRNEDLLPPSLREGIDGNTGKSSGSDVDIDSARPGDDSAGGNLLHAPVLPEGRQERNSTDGGSNDAGSGGVVPSSAPPRTAPSTPTSIWPPLPRRSRPFPRPFAHSTVNARSRGTPLSKTRTSPPRPLIQRT